MKEFHKYFAEEIQHVCTSNSLLFYKPLIHFTWSAFECFIVSPNFDINCPRYILGDATNSDDSVLNHYLFIDCKFRFL